MYLTTTTAPVASSLPTTTAASSLTITTSLRPIAINNSRKVGRPLPPIPTQQQQSTSNSFQREADLFSTPAAATENSNNMQSHFYPMDQQQPQAAKSSQGNSNNKLLIEQLSVERVSDFASQMSCYLWFSDSSDRYLLLPPATPGGNAQPQRRFSDFRPRDAFKKFCRDVVSATQVSHSVILLSLLYISRMKTNNPAIQGHPGSEYRTFTVALMLANKFLDDNTYTNKTWSEVTNISVREINIMEIEFLGSLNFSLYVSEQQYFEWLRIMNKQYQESELLINMDRMPPADCALAIPQHQQQSQPQRIQYQQQLGPVPMETTVSSSAATAYKRSAEQAFVDTGMVTSPPKRVSIYPAYTVSAPQQQSSSTYYRMPVASFSSSPTTAVAPSNGMSYAAASQQQQFGVQQSVSTTTTTKIFIQNAQQHGLVDQMQIFYAARRMQSNLFNARSAAAAAFPINTLSFPTTVV